MMLDFIIPLFLVVLVGSGIYIYYNVKAELKRRREQKSVDETE